ncbi:MAG TPA: DnaD domain-containing protein [Bacillaceae bacterium]
MNKEVMISWIEAGEIRFPNMLMEKYRQIGLDEKELVLLLQLISYKEIGNGFPTPEQLSKRMTITSTECSSILRKLIQNRFLRIEEEYTEDGIMHERYSITPLWIRLAEDMLLEQKQADMENMFLDDQDLYTTFEKEFGRPLSPIECETLAMWIDHDSHDPVIIKAALREAVISGKINFRYIDRILFEWKKNNIKTIEQARVHSLKFRQKAKTAAQSAASTNTVPFYNWLEQ